MAGVEHQDGATRRDRGSRLRASLLAPAIISVEKVAISGNQDPAKVCTSHVERTNLHVRMQMRRFTRLTNAFGRKRDNLRAALALHFAAYNFTWVQSSIRCTPAMAAGISRTPWSVRDLLTA